MTDAERAVLALREGRIAVVPTDTVYGLVCSAESERAALDLYRLKGRPAIQPTAVIFASVERLLELVPGLPGEQAEVVRALLPGPYTLVVTNAARRYAWLAADRPDSIGVRVPILPPVSAAIAQRLGAVVATSANLAGGPDPRTLDAVPQEILDGVAVAIDGGELPGTPSTVIDVTGSEPVVLRAGAADPAEALARVAQAAPARGSSAGSSASGASR
jgi:L-threonylcarbamoyladenylate synthase